MTRFGCLNAANWQELAGKTAKRQVEEIERITIGFHRFWYMECGSIGSSLFRPGLLSSDDPPGRRESVDSYPRVFHPGLVSSCPSGTILDREERKGRLAQIGQRFAADSNIGNSEN